MRALRLRAVATVFPVVVTITGCLVDGSPNDAAGPGGSAWKDDGTVDCKADTDCAPGETCTDSVCQMKRCGEPNYKSLPPIGTIGFFKRDREIIVSESLSLPGATLAGFDVRGVELASVKGDAPWIGATAPVTDTAGGNFLGTRPESVAMAVAGSKDITVKAKSGDVTIPVGFVPIALTSGDVDGDGVDEILAVGDSGVVAACKATTKECTNVSTGASVKAYDIAAGDLDGDGYAEAVVLAGTTLHVVNFDSDTTGQKRVWSTTSPVTLTNIAIGDLDSDGRDDLIGHEDSWIGGGEHVGNVHVFAVEEGAVSVRKSVEVAAGARDLAVGATGADKVVVAVLGNDKTVEVLSLRDGVLRSESKTPLQGASNPSHITLADVDGDSPTRSVQGTPKLVPGPVVPIAVLTLPPYSRTYSDGVSEAAISSSESSEKSTSTSVSLGASAGISAGFEVASVSAEISKSWSWESARSSSHGKSLAIGGAFHVESRPDKDGFTSGAVMLACACYHQYQYVIDDPKNVLGEGLDGKTMDMLIPVGGQTSVWSTRRYNALAKALKTLPEIQVPHKLGQVDSYPTSPKTLDGAPIQEEDMVFTKPPTFRTSDVAGVDFELSSSESNTNETASSTGQSLGGSLGAFGVTVNGEASVTIGNGYSVSVGRDSSFSGHVPAVQNDPGTPEDEFELYGYSFTPIVYRHHYTNRDRTPGSFYVLTYAVSK